LKQAEADYKRQADLVARQAVSQATLDTSTSNRDNAQANLQQAEANSKIAAVNYGYTTWWRRSTASSVRSSRW
jgi:multidrug resistance efflux pump